MKILKKTPPISVLALLAVLGTLPLFAAPRPNIIVILADDMGYGDCSVNNPGAKVQTPNLDQLAREGLRFTDAHSASTTCTASRYGLLTGINPARRGVVNGITSLGPVLEAKEVTIAELLKNQGYTTRMVGKWHLGFDIKPGKPRPVFDFSQPLRGGPLDHGFDSFFGLRQAVSAAPYFYIRDRAPEADPTEITKGTKTGELDRRVTYGGGDMAPGFVHEAANTTLNDEVLKIIHTQAAAGAKAKPLFLYYAMLEPHTPWLPEERFGGKSAAGPYGDYLVQMDHEVGRVLKALRDTGLDQNTLVVFSSDNGSLWPEADIQKWGHRANGPLAGGKARPEEGGHRVPFIVRWPGQVAAASQTSATINHTDFLATFADLFEVNLATAAPEAVVDSHSFLSVLNDPGVQHQRPAMAVTVGSFRQGDWKLTFNRGARSAGPEVREASNASLYNLAEDLGETKDLTASMPERKVQLFAAYKEYFVSRKLKPLAEVVRAKKKAQTEKPRSAKQTRGPSIPGETEASLTDNKRRLAELRKQQDELLSDEQRAAREAARRKAMAEGKKGVGLRAATDAGANLTEAQKKRLDELRAEQGRLMRAQRERLQRGKED